MLGYPSLYVYSPAIYWIYIYRIYVTFRLVYTGWVKPPNWLIGMKRYIWYLKCHGRRD